MNAPRVSVLMAAYNARPFLPAAIDSVLQQTLCDFELIVVDDGSTDDTLDYLGEIDDPRIHIVTQQNAGLASALESWIARLPRWLRGPDGCRRCFFT